MPRGPNNRGIKDFFKPFTIPKSRIPVNDVVEEEIIVASPKPSSPSENPRPRSTSISPTKLDNSHRSSARSSNASTPTRSLARTPKKRTWPSQIDRAAEATLIHVSPSSARQREMEAVHIPSPKVQSLPPPDFTRETAPRSAATSFSSISTLSSVPLSSQSSSRRVTKNGIKAVTNSDSGSADSDSDELADPSAFVMRKRRKLTPPGLDTEHPIEIPSTVKPARQSTRLSDKGKGSSTANTPRLPPSPPRTVYKHSLLNMVKQQEREEKTDARIRAVEHAFEESRKKREDQMRREEGLHGGLKAATADDSDEGERMMLAMQRTEALHDQESFYFFRGDCPIGRRAFPALNGPDGRLMSFCARLLKNKTSRTHAFLSGFVADIAWKERLPAELGAWMANELMYETRTDLCEAYIETLRAQASDASFNTHRTLSRLSFFHGTNRHESHSREDALEDIQSKGSSPELDDAPPGLQYIIQVVQYSCSVPKLSPYAVASSVVELMMATIDDRIKGNAELKNQICDAVEYILDALPDESALNEVCEALHKRFFQLDLLSMQVQCRAIAFLPVASERCHRVRRMLAVHLITRRTAEDQYVEELNATEWTKAMVLRLKKDPEFAISETANYALLNCLIEVLDIAIDAGFSKHPSHSSNSSQLRSEGSYAKAATSTTAEMDFNAQIDAITSQLQLMASRIRGAGTTHLRRTEAKSAFDRLITRLEHSVRTKPKPRKGIFGGVTGEQRTFLSGFLKRPDEKQEDDSSGVDTVTKAQLSADDISDACGTNAFHGAEAS